jgi:glucose/arabinose dehydrogenase
MHKSRAALFTISFLFLGLIMAQDGPQSVIRGTKEFRRTVLVQGLAGPWELTWGPDNMLWVTERTGHRITRIDPANGRRSVAITIDEVSAPGSQDGLPIRSFPTPKAPTAISTARSCA